MFMRTDKQSTEINEANSHNLACLQGETKSEQCDYLLIHFNFLS